MATLEEIEVVFLREFFRRDSFFIGEARLSNGSVANGDSGSTPPRKQFGRTRLDAIEDRFERQYDPMLVKIKGEAEPDELKPQLEYALYGRWETHEQYGRSFAINTFRRTAPHGRAGVIRYLQECPHVGQVTATRLWERFQSDAVRILRESPAVAVAAVGSGHFTDEKAVEAAKYLQGEFRLESCTIDLADLFHKRGFPKATVKKAIQRFGNRAADLIRTNPYLLLAGFRGIGFKRADQLYIDLGHPPGKLKRQALCAADKLNRDTNGHTWMPVEEAIRGIEGNVGGAELKVARALKLAKRNGIIATRRDDQNKLWVAFGKRARQEEYVAQRTSEAMHEECHWPAPEKIASLCGNLTDHQMAAMARAITAPVSMFIGGPGTGKSFCTANIIKAIIALCGHDSVAACAPTNKAAVRLTNALQQYGVDLRARSIHGLLGVESNSDGWEFVHREGNPLPQKFLFIDEASMISCDLMASILAARAAGTQILFIGDIGQLPPIQHGAPIRDYIASELIPLGELTEPMRNAGAIVDACFDIRNGRQFRECERLDIEVRPPQNFKIIHAESPQQQIDQMFRVIGVAQRMGIDPVWGLQVMSAVNQKSRVSRVELNSILQREFNRGGEGPPGSQFKSDDKVICTDNGYFPCLDAAAEYANPDGKTFIANGEFGVVLDSKEKLVTVRFDYPERIVKFPRGKTSKMRDAEDGDEELRNTSDTGCSLELAFCCTVHKMQGSETPISIPILDEYPGARMVQSREWFLTALSRGKLLSLPIGRRGTADAMCRKLSLDNRKTFLTARLKESIK